MMTIVALITNLLYKLYCSQSRLVYKKYEADCIMKTGVLLDIFLILMWVFK